MPESLALFYNDSDNRANESARETTVATLHNLRDLEKKVADGKARAAEADNAPLEAELPPEMPADANGGSSQEPADVDQVSEPEQAPPPADVVPPPPKSLNEQLWEDMESHRDSWGGERIKMVDSPGDLDGHLVGRSRLGLMVRDQVGALNYVPVHLFDDQAVPSQGSRVLINVSAKDGKLTATSTPRIGSGDKKQAGDKPPAPPADDQEPEESHAAGGPSAAELLIARIQLFDASKLRSPDPQVRDAAAKEKASITQGIQDASPGSLGGAKDAFEKKIAAVNTVKGHDQRGDAAAADDGAVEAARQREQQEQYAQQHQGGGGAGGALGGLINGRTIGAGLAGAAVLMAGGGVPLALGAAGLVAVGGSSVALQALKKAQAGVSSKLEQGRLTSADVLGKQVNSLANDIEQQTNWLRAHGLENIEREMKGSGKSLREVLPQMEKGGPLERLGTEFKGLMADPEFAQKHAELERNLDRFGVKSRNYAQAAVAAHLDPEPAIEAATAKVEQSVGSMPTLKDGKLGALMDKVSDLADSIKAMINKLMGRLAPGRS